jgi:hypothetical protein
MRMGAEARRRHRRGPDLHRQVRLYGEAIGAQVEHDAAAGRGAGVLDLTFEASEGTQRVPGRADAPLEVRFIARDV